MTWHSNGPVERVETLVIGAGQAGLSVGRHLQRRGLDFLIIDANARVGDAWRQRWDSLRLFTPARFSALEGLAFPGPAHRFPTKDEVADYLEAYAARFALPVRGGLRVDRLWRDGQGFVVDAGAVRVRADNVVVAMASHQVAKRPSFAGALRPDIVALHSSEYRNHGSLRDGRILVVGAGNSGAEIALDVAPSHPTWLAGREPGLVPFRIESPVARHVLLPLLFRVIAHRILTVRTPIGRRVRPRQLGHSAPLVRVKPADLVRAGVTRVPRVSGVRDGLPLLEDGRTIDVENVIWCTGFRPDFSWIDLRVFDRLDAPEPIHERGIVAGEPGLYFLGLTFLYAMSSGFLPGVGRDAAHVADHVAARSHAGQAM